MVTVSGRIVRQVLRARVLDIDGIPPVERWAFENRPYTPPSSAALLDHKQDAVWIEERSSITAEQRINSGEVVVFGRTRYMIGFPVNAGTETAEDTAALIVGDLHRVAHVQGQGVTVYLDRPERLTPFPRDEDWWFLPVEVAWRAYSFETQTAS